MAQEPDLALDDCIWLSGSQKNVTRNFFKVNGIANDAFDISCKSCFIKNDTCILSDVLLKNIVWLSWRHMLKYETSMTISGENVPDPCNISYNVMLY